MTSHTFAYPELNSTPNIQPAIKISVFFHRLPSISPDKFFAHWQSIHADLAIATQVFQKHILRYVQHYQTPEMKDRARSLGENVLEYDGCAQMWVRSWDDWMAFYTSEEYAAALSDDCDEFMQLPMTYMVGYENLVAGHAIGGLEGVVGFVLIRIEDGVHIIGVYAS